MHNSTIPRHGNVDEEVEDEDVDDVVGDEDVDEDVDDDDNDGLCVCRCVRVLSW